MTFRNKGIVLFMVAVLLMSGLMQQQVMARQLIPEVDKPRLGIVVDVIDGDAIKVIYKNASQMESFVDYLKFAGVDAEGSDESFRYTLDQLLGKAVYVLYADAPDIGRYRQAFVYVTEERSMSESLVERGLAKVDSEAIEGQFYDELKKAEGQARRQEIGRWQLSTTTSDIININLASKEFMMTYLDVSEAQADAIITYRIHNPINDGLELGFVDPSLGRDFLMDTRSRFHVTTAVESAGEVELASLFSNTVDAFEDAASIMRYRLFNRLDSEKDLLDIPQIDHNEDRIMPYLSLEYNGDVLVDDVDKININTASKDYLESLRSLDDSRIDALIKMRSRSDYIFRSLEELSKPQYPLSGFDVLQLADKVTFMTDVNTASELEFRSLTDVLKLTASQQNALVKTLMEERPYSNFSELKVSIGDGYYGAILPYITINGSAYSEESIVNLNTSSIASIRSIITMTDRDANQIKKYQGDIDYPGRINLNGLRDAKNYSLYTNINKATYDTLMALSPKMTRSIALAIIDERSYYPFYNTEELKTFLFDRKAYGLYNDIQAFTVYY